VDLAPDFSEFCALLNAHRVEFVIVGAHALAFHGAPRFTGDLDILVRPTIDNGQRLLSAIAEFGFPTSALTAEGVVNPRTVVEMGVPPLQLHVMSAVDGVTWDEVWLGKEPGSLGSDAVFFIGRTQFLKNKRAAARPKDLADVEALTDGDESP
jgi:hypothetical protein